MEYNIHKLNNGIRLIHAHSDSIVAHCGVIINVGSRDEKENEHGMAHFLEHALFKGTAKRRSYHILNRLESVGGDVNAYTTKEETCLYSVFLNKYYERALDLLSDMFFYSNFPEKEIEKEKGVIIDEINSYKDNPAELIFDEFEDLVFKNSSLGRNILGTPEGINNISSKELFNFHNNNYTGDKTVIFSVGNINFNKLIKLTEKYFAKIPKIESAFRDKQKTEYKPFSQRENKNTHQVHCIIGNIAYDMHNENRLKLSLLNNIAAGTNMNSRLSVALREKHGYAYDIESNYTAYSDAGIFNLYFGTDKEKLDKSIKLIKKEFNKLKNTKLGVLQLHRAQQQLMGQIAISAENKSSLASYLGKSLLLYNKVEDLNTINQKINAITSEHLIDVANEILDSNKLSMLIYE